ncbi:MAG: hypothetical protein ACXAEU_05105, partial [Candidatus Hodarchaeales archaeon]
MTSKNSDKHEIGLDSSNTTKNGLNYSLLNDRVRMYQLYIVEEKSLSEIARIVRCSRSTVYSRLKKFDIERHRYIPQKSKREKPLDRSILDDPERMNQLYVVEEKSAAEIAKIANCGKTTVMNRLRKFNIERRSTSDSISIHSTKRALSKSIPLTTFLEEFIEGSMLGDGHLHLGKITSQYILTIDILLQLNAGGFLLGMSPGSWTLNTGLARVTGFQGSSSTLPRGLPRAPLAPSDHC